MIRYSDGEPFSFLLLNHNLKVIVVIDIDATVAVTVTVTVAAGTRTSSTSTIPASLVVVVVVVVVLYNFGRWRRKRCPHLVLPLPQQFFLFPLVQFVLAVVLVSLGRSRQHHVDDAHQHDGFDGHVQRILRHQVPPPGLVQPREGKERVAEGVEQRCAVRAANGRNGLHVHLRGRVVDKVGNGLPDLEPQLVDGREQHACFVFRCF